MSTLRIVVAGCSNAVLEDPKSRALLEEFIVGQVDDEDKISYTELDFAYLPADFSRRLEFDEKYLDEIYPQLLEVLAGKDNVAFFIFGNASFNPGNIASDSHYFENEAALRTILLGAQDKLADYDRVLGHTKHFIGTLHLFPSVLVITTDANRVLQVSFVPLDELPDYRLHLLRRERLTTPTA